MKNKILPIILIVGLLFTSIGIVITRINLEELQESILVVSKRLEQRDLTLASTKDTLLNTQADLRNNQVALTNVETKLLDTERKLSLTEVELGTNKGKLEAITRELSTTKDKLESTRAELTEAIETISTTKGKLDSTARELSTTKVELTTLRQRVSLIGDLEERIKSLNSEIKGLEAKRLVLIPKTREAIFSCTGSMDPKITCMDTAIYLTNFKPEDITIGSVISYNNIWYWVGIKEIVCDLDSGCMEADTLAGCPTGKISHRVTAIKIEGGKYFYRTKGDNNSEDDGCWIPSKAVNGYMISLTKGSDSVMEGLLSYVWSLESKAKSGNIG